MEVTETLDTSGLSCPLPVLKTKKAIKGLAVGDLLKVISTDPGAKKDIPSWARVTGQEIVETSEDGERIIFIVKKLK